MDEEEEEIAHPNKAMQTKRYLKSVDTKLGQEPDKRISIGFQDEKTDEEDNMQSYATLMDHEARDINSSFGQHYGEIATERRLKQSNTRFSMTKMAEI